MEAQKTGYVPINADAGQRPTSPNPDLPLVLDADDALITTDMLHETAVGYVRANPLRLARLAGWITRGPAFLKRQLSQQVPLDIDLLPVNADLVAYAENEAQKGREIVLATAADEFLAKRLARRFGFITTVIASDGTRNMKGANKADALDKHFPDGYVYAGDSAADLAIWSRANAIILAGAAPAVARQAERLGKPIEARFPRPQLGLKGWVKALRVHQWAKNALVFVPLLLSGMVAEPLAIGQAMLAFLAISLMASGTYLINDLFDLADDRAHWSKRNRPLAAGLMRIKHGVIMAPLLMLVSLLAGAFLSGPAAAVVLLYAVLTLAYSAHLKRLAMVDVFTLAILFTLRLGLGTVAIGCPPSPWLLVFSMFLFGSLSFAKRQTEIQRSLAKGQEVVKGRGYRGSDAPLIMSMGVASAMASITIMVLYIMNDVYSAELYRQPLFLWTFPAALFLWTSRIWFLCHRGELHDDPVVFALRDNVSLALGGLMTAAFLAGWLL